MKSNAYPLRRSRYKRVVRELREAADRIETLAEMDDVGPHQKRLMSLKLCSITRRLKTFSQLHRRNTCYPSG